MPPKSLSFVDVTKENLVSIQHIIEKALNSASFIALDTEFTGLGGKEANTKAPIILLYLLSQVDHIISPQSLQFLSDSGFDFNKQIRKGIPYFPGCDKSNSNLKDPNNIMRSIFSYILSRNFFSIFIPQIRKRTV
ncbi:unnamed protein product [Rhizophagus irregularis]|nr:unnamed protein product [Rhizophagus irregularis]